MTGATGATIAETVGRTLAALGCRQVFGVIGSGNFVVTRAMVDAGAGFVAARHETAAVTMADAWARVSGEVGVASVHQGPGFTNALTGLAEAAKSFQADRGVKFSTFAYYRIRGAIYDGITEMLWFRQQPRSRIKFERLANDLLQTELSESVATTPAPLHDEANWLKDIASSLAVVCLACHGSEGRDDWMLIDPSTVSPLDAMGWRELHEELTCSTAWRPPATAVTAPPGCLGAE